LDGRIVELAVKYRLPAIYSQKEYVDEGGLMSYGVDYDDLFRKSAHYVDKILKEAKPADLPVQQATKFEFVINLKAAKQIGQWRDSTMSASIPTSTILARTMSDTVETDIRRVHVIANEVLPRYKKCPLSFEELRKVADGPFDLFLIPLVFDGGYRNDPSIVFNEEKRQEIRNHALEIAKKNGFDVNPPDLVPGIEESLVASRDAGLSNVLLTTGGRRFKHQAMEERGLGKYFDDIIDREETYFRKEQGIYHLFRQRTDKFLRVILVSGTATYIRAGNNLERLAVAGKQLEVFTVALATEDSYNDEETLAAAKPKMIVHSLQELTPSLRDRGLIPASAA
jgi:phosphoglycolate phosphatase-like HAD superfamily hydrolase